MSAFSPRPYEDPAHAAAYTKRSRTTRGEFRAIRKLLAGRGPFGTILDVPCGNGRLWEFLGEFCEGRLFGADGAAEMVRQADPARAERLVADASALPLATGSADLVVSMRLLHHFEASAARRTILAEYARVSRGLVLVTFYDRFTLEGLRRRHRPKRAGTRFGVSRREFFTDLAAAGLKPVAISSLLPLVREQTLVLSEVSS